MKKSRLQELQTRSNLIFTSASDYLNKLTFFCRFPAHVLRNPLPLEDETRQHTNEAKAAALVQAFFAYGLKSPKTYAPLNQGPLPLNESLPAHMPYGAHLERDESYVQTGLGFFGPIWTDEMGPNHFVKGKISISRMTDLYNNNIDVVICDDNDIPEIFYRMDNYLTSVKKQLDNPDILSYVEKLLKFREAFFDRIFLPLMGRRPDLKEIYLEDLVDPFSLDILTGSVEYADDPILKLKTPPISLPEPVIETKEEKEPMGLTDSLWGL